MSARASETDVDCVAFSRAAQLTNAFYAWERRGRGWDVWPYPVALEPPFRAFSLPVGVASEVTDDGRKPTFLSSVFERLFGREPTPQVEAPGAEEPEPAAAAHCTYDELRVVLAPDVKVVPEACEQFLVGLGSCSAPVAFEIVGTSEMISVQVACSSVDTDQVRAMLQAYFPEAVLSDSTGSLRDEWTAGSGEPLVVDFGLSQEFMRPLRTFSKFDVDPLISVVGALADLAEGEVAVLQTLFQSTRKPWSDSILRSVTNWQGEAFFLDAPELVAQAEKKIAAPLFAVNVRAAVRSVDRERSWQLAKRIGGALGQVANPPHNELIALDPSDECPADAQVRNLLRRQTQRTGMLLNSSELVSLVHPPSTSVRSTRLTREHRRTKLAPKVLLGQALVLGENAHGQTKQRVTLNIAQRLRHMHVIGASGTGKSTFLLNLIAQDMQNDRGLAVLDPHGQLVDDVLARVPDHRVADVVLVDPADTEFPVGLNVLSAHSELEKTLLASDLVAVFRRLSTTWGDQMTSILSNAVLAFLESSRGGTLADLRRFLVETEFRSDFLSTVGDPEVVYFWQKEFPLLTGRPQASLLTRLDTFLRPRPVRAMVTQQQSLDFARIMNEGKILLVRLAQGAIGEENAALLGSLFVSKIHQMALSRQALEESERRPFIVYADEFAQFVTPSMATLLTGARKYGIGLVLAHQELRQLMNQDRDVAGAVLANTATRVCFRVGDDDAKKLEEGFASFTARDIQNLGVGQAIARVERADWDFSLVTPNAPLLAGDQGRAARIREASRGRYGARPSAGEEQEADDHRPLAAVSVTPTSTKASPKSSPSFSSSSSGSFGSTRSNDLTTYEEPASDLSRRADRPFPDGGHGRGGAQHRYLQALVQRWGEVNGWKVTLEQEILAGLGRVDVLLERPGVTVACEIGVTSSVEHEIANIQKCVAAGFSYVASIVADKRFANRLSARVADLIPGAPDRIRVLSVDGLFEFLTRLESDGHRTTENIRGYQVKTTRGAGSARNTVARTVARALQRLKG